jgi:hypothetical protein
LGVGEAAEQKTGLSNRPGRFPFPQRPNSVFFRLARIPSCDNDGIWVIDALGGKLLHVLIDLRCKSAKFIHAHALLTLEVQRSRDRLQPLASNQKISYLNGHGTPVRKPGRITHRHLNPVADRLKNG